MVYPAMMFERRGTAVCLIGQLGDGMCTVHRVTWYTLFVYQLMVHSGPGYVVVVCRCPSRRVLTRSDYHHFGLWISLLVLLRRGKFEDIDEDKRLVVSTRRSISVRFRCRTSFQKAVSTMA